MTKYHVGVDVGKDKHQVSIRDLSSDAYYKAFSVTNDHSGFTEFISSLEKLSMDKDDFLIGVEACSYGLNLSISLLVQDSSWLR